MIWLITLFGLFFPQGRAQQGQPYAVVRVEAWTTAAQRIEDIDVVLTPVFGGREYKATGRSAEVSVPTGDYVLRVDAAGFSGRRQILRAYQPETLRTVALPVARIEGNPGYSSLSGTVHNYEGDLKRLRVRAMSLFGSEVREGHPDFRGSFAFPVDEGDLLVFTIADTDNGPIVLDSKPVRVKIATNERIEIDLKGKHP